MFMKNIMHHVHKMMLVLQTEELNVIDALTIIECTVILMKQIRDDEN